MFHGKEYLYPRKRPKFRNWDKDTSGVELRHLRSLTLTDEQVIQVSRGEWLVASTDDGGPVFAVERAIEEDEALVEGHNASCAFWGVDDIYNVNEGYCRSCFICCHLYNCDCPDKHPICKHVHKVHSFNLKVIENQRPHELDKTIDADFEKLEKVRKSIKERDKVEFSEEILWFLNNLENKFELKNVLD
ncbi:uncharacterized protein LOC132205574 [Neocloeon triangulifer]|uniref:uncharacterized protein LOC132205574 n=1 Tax=Neocloeon triangulifer TaxID=2078957 RepID=UPI00286F0DA6|nr:uncharacterized protein LOC132205574 [Neocloeon triangulifer]